jgi:hypothetical protein
MPSFFTLSQKFTNVVLLTLRRWNCGIVVFAKWLLKMYLVSVLFFPFFNKCHVRGTEYIISISIEYLDLMSSFIKSISCDSHMSQSIDCIYLSLLDTWTWYLSLWRQYLETATCLQDIDYIYLSLCGTLIWYLTSWSQYLVTAIYHKPEREIFHICWCLHT